MMLTLLILAIAFGIGSSIIASNRGESSGTWFVIGFLLGPIGLLWSLTTGKRCQFCQSKIHSEATACPKCGKEQASEIVFAVAEKEAPASNKDPATEKPAPPHNILIYAVAVAVVALAVALIRG